MAEQDPATTPVDYSSIGEQVAAGILKIITTAGLQKLLVSAGVERKGAEIATLGQAAADIGVLAGKAMVALEEPVMPILSGITAAIVSNLFDTPVSAGAFASHGARGERQAAATAVVSAVMAAIAGNGTSAVEPSDEGAKRIATASVHAAIEGWFNGVIPEIISDFAPFEWLHFEDLAELGEDVIRALGIGRLVRRALSPLVDVSATMPMRWHVNRIYRPELLSAGDVVRQIVRGRWSREQGFEELARQGWSDDRIEALLNAAAKFHSVADLDLLVRAGERSRGDAIQHLREQGYDEHVADVELTLERLKRIATFERSMATAAIDAYADGRIDGVTLDAFTHGATIDEQESAQLRELAHAKHALRVRPLTASEARQAVKEKVLAVSDYRNALRQEGRDENAVLVLELMLRAELDTEKAMADHRVEAEADRMEERAARAAAAAERKAQLDADRALKRRGTVSDLERAVVRGLIPINRYAEVIAESYDPDTVAIMIGLVEGERQGYLTQQEKAAAAAQKAERRGLDVGALNAAVLEHVISVADFRMRLSQLGFDAGDVDVLTETIAAKLNDQDTARADRARAEAEAKAKKIDLGRFEQLVRRGVRSMTEYDALLQSLGFDDASRAAMIELLQLHIADDTRAAEARAAHDAALRPGELTIDQFRRSVLLNLKTETEFDAFLTSLNLSADVHALLAAELHDDLAQAEAARQKREQDKAPTVGRVLSLDTVRRAARLGIITVETYRQRLIDAGYSSDDIAIELDLLLLEIADVQAARAKRDAAAQQVDLVGLSLADTARAVRGGFANLEAYRARAFELGLSSDDVDTLTRVLADELRETQAAKVRRAAIASELDAKSVSLANLDDQVRAGDLTLDDYGAELVALGYAADDVELLAALLADEIGAGVF